jgi:hypothetical protein
MLRNPTSLINDPPAGFDGQMFWDHFTPAFHREGATKQIEPMDIDAMVERFHRFLAWETKEPGCEVPTGQSLTLRALILALPPRSMYLIHCAKRIEDIDGFTVWFRLGGEIEVRPHESDGPALVEWCREWFLWACQNPGPSYVPRARSKPQADRVGNGHAGRAGADRPRQAAGQR